MATPPTHRNTASVSTAHLAPPTADPARPRRMTSPSLPPPTPLDLPEPVQYGRRPPSPLRQSFTADPDTGDVSEDGSSFDSRESGEHRWGRRPQSPTPSVAQFIAQKMGSLMSGMSSRASNHLPTDEELEAEAERERDRTRREAERILSREADTRRLEERVLAMLDSDMRKTMAPPSTPPPVSSSPKEGGSWLTAVKQKLTPTKESLTPAQQIIQEAKAREREIEKEERRLEKEKKEMEKELKKQTKKQSKQRSGEWPSSPEGKFNDPAFLTLARPAQPPPTTPPRRQMSASPVSPTPARQHSMPPSLAPSPLRTNDAGSSSPSRSGPPLYAQFNTQGALDIPGTLLTIAGRFEKLERWTVSHVRALEERMDDVERWLVEKEKEKESASTGVTQQQTGEPASTDAAMHEIRDELAEVQGRIGELGREIAKMVTSPGNLSSGPSRSSGPLNRAPSTSSSIAVRSMSAQPPVATQSQTPPKRQDSVSPSVTTPPVPSASARTRLPYPTGDYATPPDSVMLHQGPFSPPGSPPSVQPGGSRRPSISGLPVDSFDFTSAGNSPSGLPSSRATSPPSLPPPPERASLRRASVSPTPRKRYTVALGGPIMAASREREPSVERPMTPHSRSQSRELGTALFSTSPVSMSASLHNTDDSDSGGNEETIGKAAARNSGLTFPDSQDRKGQRISVTSLSSSMETSTSAPKRARPQSMYNGRAQNIAAPRPITPLNTRLRSQSTDRLSLNSDAAGSDTSTGLLPPSTPNSAKFVDPLVIRRQTKEAQANTAAGAPKIMPGKPKVPIGQLVAYFNQDKS